MPLQFAWRADAAPGPFSLVLLDAAYDEIARVDGIAGTHWVTRAALAKTLGAGGVFHWFVVDASSGSTRRSALETVEIR